MAKPKKICMVDDEEDFLAVASGLLRLQGFEVETYSDPVQGVEMLLKSHFDLIVLDLMMPELNGFDVLGKLREADSHGNTLIFALTSKRLSNAERLHLQRNDVHFLAKPFDPNSLAERIALLTKK